MIHDCRVLFALLITSSTAIAAEPSVPQPTIHFKSAVVSPLLLKSRGEQVLKFDGEYRGAPQLANARLNGTKIGDVELTGGEFALQAPIPAVDEEQRSTLTIETPEGAVLGSTEVVRRPVRELTIYVVPHSHVDIGYTELQPAIETKQVNNLLTALDLIEKTKDNPPGSQYRWTVEAAWTIDNLLRDRPDKIAALKQALEAGQVELDGAFGNLLTALCRPEELMRSYAWGGSLRSAVRRARESGHDQRRAGVYLGNDDRVLRGRNQILFDRSQCPRPNRYDASGLGRSSLLLGDA